VFKGRVSDEFGPLSGANIILKDTRIGTVSDDNGYYEIEARKADTLLISYLGYDTDSVIVSENKHGNTVLGGSVVLNEVEIIGSSSTKCWFRCCGYSVKCSYRDFTPVVLKEKLYPNPSKTGRFHLELLDNYKKIQIHISDISGNFINMEERNIDNKNLAIDLSKLPSGIYIINIIADGKRLSPKKAIRG
ncbi:carboxypeptidase-like regulatory domain-containing protein, partial [Algibacter sp.]|nr:carboxypeptidase-like regulatory domain-containing protein [Algibacter sp.]